MTDIDAHEGDLTAASTRHAAEWGLASLLTGGTILIMCPIMLLLNIHLGLTGHKLMNATDLALARIGLYIAISLVLGLAVVSSLFGVVGVLSAVRRRQPAGLALAGTFASLVAVISWLFTAINTVSIVETLRRGGF